MVGVFLPTKASIQTVINIGAVVIFCTFLEHSTLNSLLLTM